MTGRPAVTVVRSRMVALPAADIDTDQIIPARFLKGTVREGLGGGLFADWRGDASRGSSFALDRPEAAGAQILVAGPNFGCGSSREHAVWALMDAGFRAVVSTRLADIFRRNALQNGLVPVEIESTAHASLVAAEGEEARVDVAALTVSWSGGLAAFSLPPFARRCLMEGRDELDILLTYKDAIAAHERGASLEP
ncbi:MAG TPA: 3-isopropylmalate dehydratase small subunit [Vicinamibacteria bacterium]|nr:3-isopropylmalate dehydratase small subunit [Vicinamibacteria bacterium]